MTDTSTEAIAEMSRKLRSQDQADLPWRMEVADTHDALAAERDNAAAAQMDAVENWTRAELRRVDAERERDALAAENGRLKVCLNKANGQTEHFERQYYLAKDACEAAEAENAAIAAEVERLRYVLEGVRGAIDTGRNEPLQIWRDQIAIALQASAALKGAANG